ncbi:sigma-70 family RNA polymerase sigma factor [Streptomyces erythrochromogenes]|uniref:sigma-70 family RNA polymerase sigma factor n=1 Tax=Streptomyces erythrochromogenes TaxID=285574 RepID=UPI0037CCE560
MPVTPAAPPTPVAPTTPTTADAATDQFVGHRELLFSVVYNMLGAIADTEDVLQEVWLAWSARNRRPSAGPVDNVRAYLVRIAVNQALARRADISRRREAYVGPWLPEPLLPGESDAVAGAAEQAERAEALSMAVLVVLETLSPLERAVFVLHEVFGFAHTEIGSILGRSPAAVRQLASRARRHVRERRPRHRPVPDLHARVTERFAEAALGGDLRALMELLAPDVTLWTDGGGKGPAVGLRPVHGRDRVAAVFAAVARGLPAAGLAVSYRWVAGDPCALVFSGAGPLAAVIVDLIPDGERIAGIFSVTNPDKLTGGRRASLTVPEEP